MEPIQVKMIIPRLDPDLEEKYEGLRKLHAKFWAFCKQFHFIHLVTLNFEKLVDGRDPSSRTVHMIRPYEGKDIRKIKQSIIKPDSSIRWFNYTKKVIQKNTEIVQFAYNKSIYEKINSTNTELAAEFKTTMRLIKLGNTTKFLARCSGTYHLILFGDTFVFTNNAFKNATGLTYPKRIASSSTNKFEKGKLNVFNHMLHLLSGNNQLIEMSGEKSSKLVEITRDVMIIRPRDTIANV